jgi:hypothetical protein
MPFSPKIRGSLGTLKFLVVRKLMGQHTFTQFSKNGMTSFCEDRHMNVDDIRNAIALRADMHQLFDGGEFAYVPKNGEMRLHFLYPLSTHSHMQYQNTIFPMTHIPFQLLYARFAWAVFKRINSSSLGPFFDADGKPRDYGDTGGDGGDGDDGDSGGEAWGEEDYDPGLGGEQRSTPASPRRSKRKRGGGSAAGEQVDSEGSYHTQMFYFFCKFVINVAAAVAITIPLGVVLFFVRGVRLIAGLNLVGTPGT